MELPLLSLLLFVHTTTVQALNICPLNSPSHLAAGLSPSTVLLHFLTQSSLVCGLPHAGIHFTLLPSPWPPSVVLCHWTQQILNCQFLHCGGWLSYSHFCQKLFFQVPCMSVSNHSYPIFLYCWHSVPLRSLVCQQAIVGHLTFSVF